MITQLANFMHKRIDALSRLSHIPVDICPILTDAPEMDAILQTASNLVRDRLEQTQHDIINAGTSPVQQHSMNKGSVDLFYARGLNYMKNILVVDDDTAILKVISNALEDQHKVFLAETVANAEEIVNKNTINLLITDLVMPDKNGIDMIMAFRKKYPEMKIMAISGGGGITGRFDYLPIAKRVGAEITLKKPFSISELRTSVKQLTGS